MMTLVSLEQFDRASPKCDQMADCSNIRSEGSLMMMSQMMMMNDDDDDDDDDDRDDDDVALMA